MRESEDLEIGRFLHFAVVVWGPKNRYTSTIRHDIRTQACNHLQLRQYRPNLPHFFYSFPQRRNGMESNGWMETFWGGDVNTITVNDDENNPSGRRERKKNK